jgi:RNA recognition motif-containing protein
MKKIFVGNLSFHSREDAVRQAFEQFGSVASVHVITDRETGRSKGFGFVEMDDDVASKAISALNGTELEGRQIVVNEARPMVRRNAGDGQHRGMENRRSRY